MLKNGEKHTFPFPNENCYNLWLNKFNKIPESNAVKISIKNLIGNYLDKINGEVAGVANMFKYLSKEGYQLMNVSTSFTNAVISKILEIHTESCPIYNYYDDNTLCFLYVCTGIDYGTLYTDDRVV
jgi:hypothetical protein